MRFKNALLFALLAMLLTFCIIIIGGSIGLFTGCSFERVDMLETIEQAIDESEAAENEKEKFD